MPYATTQESTTLKEMVERRAMGARTTIRRASVTGRPATPLSPRSQVVLAEDAVHEAGSLLTFPNSLLNASSQSLCVHDGAAVTDNEPATSHPVAQSAQSSEELPPGTVMGTPPVRGRPAFPLQMEAHEIAAAVVRGVKANNYPFLRQMLMLGWVSTEATGMYEFSIVILRGGTHCETVPVRAASMLHYAICCSSFECAAALLIAQPSLVESRCYIGAAGVEMSTTDLASFLCGLYCQHEPETDEVYRTICAVLCEARSNPAALPFLTLPSAAERLTAAGPDGEAVVAALTLAVADKTHLVQPMHHVDIN